MYRIMIVDDEPLILAGIASLLNWEEYQYRFHSLRLCVSVSF